MPAFDQFEARFEKQLLSEWIAHLNAWPLGVAGFGEIFGGERCPMNSVATGARTHSHDRIANALGLGANEVLFVHESDAHRIHQRIALVSGIEDDLTSDGRNADTIAVIPDSLDDTGKQVSHPRIVERSETEGIEHCDRPRTHGEYVAENSADAGRCSLIRLDGGRMVVRFNLECDGQPTTDRYHARVFSRSLQHIRRTGRQGLENGA